MKTIFSKFEYEAVILAFLLIKMFYRLPYRGLTLSIALAMVACIFITLVLGKLIRHANRYADEKTRRTLALLVAFLLGSSVLNGIIFAGKFVNRGLIVNNVIFVFCLIVAFATTGKAQDNWHIPIFCFVCCAIQPAFVFVFMPAIIVLLLYNAYLKSYASQSILLGGACLIAAAAALLLFGKDIKLVEDLSLANVLESSWKNIVYSLAIVFPLILIFAMFWANTVIAAKDKMFKFIIILIMVQPIFSVVALAFSEAFIDSVMASALVQFCFLFYFLHIKDSAFMSVFDKAVQIFDRNLLTTIFVLIYLTAFSLVSPNYEVANWLGY